MLAMILSATAGPATVTSQSMPSWNIQDVMQEVYQLGLTTGSQYQAVVVMQQKQLEEVNAYWKAWCGNRPGCQTPQR